MANLIPHSRQTKIRTNSRNHISRKAARGAIILKGSVIKALRKSMMLHNIRHKVDLQEINIPKRVVLTSIMRELMISPRMIEFLSSLMAMNLKLLLRNRKKLSHLNLKLIRKVVNIKESKVRKLRKKVVLKDRFKVNKSSTRSTNKNQFKRQQSQRSHKQQFLMMIIHN